MLQRVCRKGNPPTLLVGKAIVQKDTCTSMFTAALFTTAKTWKQSECPPTQKWIKKMWYIQGNITWPLKIIMPFVTTCMNLEIIILSNVSQIE